MFLCEVTLQKILVFVWVKVEGLDRPFRILFPYTYPYVSRIVKFYIFTLYASLALFDIDRNLLIFRYLQEHSVSLGKLCSITIFCHIFSIWVVGNRKLLLIKSMTGKL